LQAVILLISIIISVAFLPSFKSTTSPLIQDVQKVPVLIRSFDGGTDATTYYTENSKILSDNVVMLAVGNGALRWFGTKGGVSVFDDSAWKSYTLHDGLISSNILCISADKNGTLWMGTDNGIMSFNNSEFITYK